MNKNNTGNYSKTPKKLIIMGNHIHLEKERWLNKFQERKFSDNYLQWKAIISSEENKDYLAFQLAEKDMEILMLEYEYLSLIKYKWLCSCLLIMIPMFLILLEGANSYEETIIFSSIIKVLTVSTIGFIIAVIFSNINLSYVKDGKLIFYNYVNRIRYCNLIITICITFTLIIYLLWGLY